MALFCSAVFQNKEINKGRCLVFFITKALRLFLWLYSGHFTLQLAPDRTLYMRDDLTFNKPQWRAMVSNGGEDF